MKARLWIYFVIINIFSVNEVNSRDYRTYFKENLDNLKCKIFDTNSPEKCHKCHEGFFLNKVRKICEKCKIENCEKCASSTICDECIHRFYVKNSKCEICPGKNCQICDKNSPLKCSFCEKFYAVDQDTGKCVAIFEDFSEEKIFIVIIFGTLTLIICFFVRRKISFEMRRMEDEEFEVKNKSLDRVDWIDLDTEEEVELNFRGGGKLEGASDEFGKFKGEDL